MDAVLMNTHIINLSYTEAIPFLVFLIQNFTTEIDYNKNVITIFDEHDHTQIKYNYPLVLNLNENVIKDKNLLNNCINSIPPFLMMLIQTGNAALGLYKDGNVLQHKVIRKYMTRQKQGKSQLKYLKTKGKSRAGSRIRLANSVQFFEEINRYLVDWTGANSIETIIYSCTPMLWGMLFQSKISPPFTKKDKQLKKLPLSTGVPNFKIMKSAARYSQKGYIHIMPDCNEELQIHTPAYFGCNLFESKEQFPKDFMIMFP